jgi:hypothetical protein
MRVKRSYTGHGTAASDGSLTVLVHPNQVSSFRYRDDGHYWVTFTSNAFGGGLTLGQSQASSLPVIYRVAGWPSPPASVGFDWLTVTVNQANNVHPVSSEDAVNGSTGNAWFYDTSARRLLIKVFRGVVAPPPPRLNISKTHSGNFTQGQQNEMYALVVSNAAGAGPTTGAVTVTENPPSGMALVSMAGDGWACGAPHAGAATFWVEETVIPQSPWE